MIQRIALQFWYPKLQDFKNMAGAIHDYKPPEPPESSPAGKRGDRRIYS